MKAKIEVKVIMKRYKPAIDKYFCLIWIPTIILLLICTIISLVEPIGFIIMLFTDIFCYYFLISSLVGYVEFREDYLYIKFGFILKRCIPYNKIREIAKERKLMTSSMLSLKNSL